MTNFTFKEFKRSSVAKKHGIDNTIPEEYKQNIVALVDNVLDPLREAYGDELPVSSGYRCPALNKIVGGKENSFHQFGLAADIDTGSKYSNRRVYLLCKKLDLPVRKVLGEKDFSWVHISFDYGTPLKRYGKA